MPVTVTPPGEKPPDDTAAEAHDGTDEEPAGLRPLLACTPHGHEGLGHRDGRECLGHRDGHEGPGHCDD